MIPANHALHKKRPYPELFWSVFTRIRTEYRGTRITPNTDTFHAMMFWQVLLISKSSPWTRDQIAEVILKMKKLIIHMFKAILKYSSNVFHRMEIFQRFSKRVRLLSTITISEKKLELRSNLDQAKREQRKKWKLLRKQRKLARKKILNVRLFYSFCMPKG